MNEEKGRLRKKLEKKNSMSWGRGVHNEQLTRKQRLALHLQAPENVDDSVSAVGKVTSGVSSVNLKVLQFGLDVGLQGVGPRHSCRAYISRSDVPKELMDESENLFIFVRTHAQVLAKCSIHAQVPDGCIVLSEMHRQNLEVTRQDSFLFHLYDPVEVRSQFELRDVEITARPASSGQ